MGSVSKNEILFTFCDCFMWVLGCILLEGARLFINPAFCTISGHTICIVHIWSSFELKCESLSQTRVSRHALPYLTHLLHLLLHSKELVGWAKLAQVLPERPKRSLEGEEDGSNDAADSKENVAGGYRVWSWSHPKWWYLANSSFLHWSHSILLNLSPIKLGMCLTLRLCPKYNIGSLNLGTIVTYIYSEAR